jgi:hypothetical protein
MTVQPAIATSELDQATVEALATQGGGVCIFLSTPP